MRKPLYRGKRVDNGEWIESKCILQFTDSIYFPMAYGNVYEVLPESVGEWTGLTDKNGNKIFEGDIVDVYCVQNGELKHRVGHIGWCEAGFLIFVQNGYNEILSKWISTVTKITGNIHDNPELLGGEMIEKRTNNV